MEIIKKLESAYEQFQEWRTLARAYPIYRIVERTLRVSIWAGIIATITTYFASPELSSAIIKTAIGAGIAAGADKLKNEYANFRREWDITRWETIKALFENEDEYY